MRRNGSWEDLQARSGTDSLSKMYSSAIIAGLFGLYQMTSGVVLPARAEEPAGFVVSLLASDYFPHSKGDLSPFDIDAYFANYDDDTKSWLTALDPHTGATDEEKARMLTEAAYAKKFDENDPDMAEDVQSLLAAVAGNPTTALTKRSNFLTDSSHAVVWSACAAFFSCISGTTCTFDLQVNKAPRSHCEQHGGSNCCISWSTYNVRVGFFSTTWTACNNEVQAEHKTSASCEGYGSGDQGGDVCLSNRASGCT
ncbi:hypothetical protein BDV59DRAFT_180314 [Aspergillus ambiguus]|uniref:uncharacterized protein n=1 Tax=Aspergillus ambiguus TaxID=176160 RepID=UPI003CCD7B00